MLRRGRPGDGPAIARVLRTSWRATYRGLISDEHLGAMDGPEQGGRWEAILGGTSPGSAVFVVEEAGAVVGFASGGHERDADPRHLAELYAIYLLEGAQGRGRGRRLVGAVAEAMLEAGRPSLLAWVLKTNTGARGFYERLGGIPAGEKWHRYGGGFEALEVAYGWADVRGTLTSAK